VSYSKIKSIVFYDTFGALTTANLIICLISGVLLAIPYDIADPYGSLSYIMIADWGGTLFRNLHYWSAQLFLIFTILHIWDHFKKSTEKSIKTGVWLRLTISILVTFFVMLSGFILKGDQDSFQAFRILTALINTIPFAGEFIARSLLGNESDLQLLYVHHIATGTAFLIIVLFEHIRNVWPKIKTFLITTLILLLISLVFRAPLHDNINPLVKGPWYFVGLQEILHWVSKPGYTLLIVLFLLLAIKWKINVIAGVL